MKTIRAIASGSLIWLAIFSLFAILSFISGIRDSQLLQGIILGVFIIPLASFGAAIYYKNAPGSNGMLVALVMVGTALLLDVLITVPFFEIPYNGSSYLQFFTNPLLWFLVIENIAVIYFYWKIKVKPSFHS